MSHTALALIPVLFPALLQEDVLQLKDDGSGERKILVGKVLAMTDASIEFQDRKQGKMTLPMELVEPYSVYRIKESRIDPKSGAAHLELGEWCMTTAMHVTAIREFTLARQWDPSLASKADERIRAAQEEDARGKLEEARRHILAKRYDAAASLLSYIMRNYPDTSFGERAREESDKVAEAIRSEIEDKEKMLEAEKKEGEKKEEEAKTEGVQKTLREVLLALEEAKKAFADGLLWEAKDNLTQTRKSWENAERSLDRARLTLQPLLKSTDPAVVKEAERLEKELVDWLVRVTWRLGRNYAEQLSYGEAVRYLNQATALPHDAVTDELINRLMVTITELRMRQRASGSTGPSLPK